MEIILLCNVEYGLKIYKKNIKQFYGSWGGCGCDVGDNDDSDCGCDD